MKTPKTSAENINNINALDLKTQRLHLTKFRERDIDFNVEHEMNPELMRYIRDPLSREETLKKTLKCVPDYTGKESDWVLIAVRLIDTQQYIGIVCFRYESIENDTVEIGWRLGSEFHGKGYATEAARALLDFIKIHIKPHKVMAYCVKENTASSHIMSKLGMQQEACFREFSKLGGQWFDEAVYGLILN